MICKAVPSRPGATAVIPQALMRNDMTDDLEQAVARAMYEHWAGIGGFGEYCTWELLPDKEKEDWVRSVRAAIPIVLEHCAGIVEREAFTKMEGLTLPTALYIKNRIIRAATAIRASFQKDEG